MDFNQILEYRALILEWEEVKMLHVGWPNFRILLSSKYVLYFKSRLHWICKLYLFTTFMKSVNIISFTVLNSGLDSSGLKRCFWKRLKLGSDDEVLDC